MRLCPCVCVCGSCIHSGEVGCWAGPGYPWRVSSATISPSSSPALLSGPRGTSVARRTGGHVYLAPWGPGHMPRPTRAPFPLLSPEPPRFIKEPKDQIGVSGGVASFVCQATGDPKPRVTWNKKGKKVNSQRFEVSGQGREGRQPRASPPTPPHPRHGAMAAQPWKPSQEHSYVELAPSPSGTLLFIHHLPGRYRETRAP